MAEAVQTDKQVPPASGARWAALLVATGNLLVVCGCAYVIARALFLSHAGYAPMHLFLGVLLLTSELFVLFHAMAFLMNLIGSLRHREPPAVPILDWAKAPSVALLVPARHEPSEVLSATLVCLDNLDYPNKTVYLLDDSSLPEYQREAEALAKRHGARLYRREARHGAKAGILNDCIRGLQEKYVAVFDADQEPIPGFLKAIVPHLEANPRLAYVQTPQFYTNHESSPVAAAANIQHCIFYEYICEGKGALNSMICCGTNVVLQREALLAVGGFDETSVTEDFSTSVDFQINGWQSMYLGHVYAFGTGPERLAPYLKQQWRWSRGNLGVLRKVLANLIRRPGALSLWQWGEYLATGSYYLVGWAYFFLMLCPVLYLFFRVPSFFMSPEIYLLTFVPYFSLAVTLFYAGMARRRYRFWQLWSAMALGFVAIPVYMAAAVAALFNTKAKFTVTPKAAGVVTPYVLLWKQIALWLVNYAAVVWGFNRMLAERDPAIAVCLVWVLFHFVVLSSLFYFRDGGRRTEPLPAQAQTGSADAA